jgi:hypothetical protein
MANSSVLTVVMAPFLHRQVPHGALIAVPTAT